MIGQTLAHFRITAKLGEGGMGEVYRAEDSKLGREVAIKVLPEAFTADPERLARFEREARVLASLNHPNIAGIYEIGEEGAVHFLAMELAEGQDLATRLDRGAIPLDDALSIALQIAEALEAAHDCGIVHRDLKPANVMVASDGAVKVLDFGLAKAREPGEATDTNLTASPTLTAQMTHAGVILGTASYMSPEQARGQEADRRADVWSFGVLLHEMLAGERLFRANTVSDTLARVLMADLDWETIDRRVPAPITALLRRCLERDTKQRLQAIAEARIVLQGYLQDPEAAEAAAPGALSDAREPVRGGAWKLVVALLVGMTLATVAWKFLGARPTATAVNLRSSLSMPSDVTPVPVYDARPLTFSPDGLWLVFVGTKEGTSRLYKRSLEQFEAQEIPGTENASNPVFSPDSQWLGYSTDGELHKVPIDGGPSQTLTSFSDWVLGADWATDGTLVFNREWKGLWRVSGRGGEPELLAGPDASRWEFDLEYPDVLPEGQAVLYTALRGLLPETSEIGILDLTTGARETLIENASWARYVPTGHLIFGRSAGVFLVPFDLERLEVIGTPVPTPQPIFYNREMGVAHLAFAPTGALAFIPGQEAPNNHLVSVDMEGDPIELFEAQRAYTYPRYSPDGQRLAVTIHDAEGSHIWTANLSTGALTKLTSQGSNMFPLWTPDGERVVFYSDRSGGSAIYWLSVDGSEPPEKLVEGDIDSAPFPCSWAPDGSSLVYFEAWQDPSDPETRGNTLWRLDVTGDGVPEQLGNGRTAAVSPDGRWLAHVEAGQILVRPLDRNGGRQQLSTDGGDTPVWSPDGRHVYYRAGSNIMRVAIEATEDLVAQAPEVLFENDFAEGTYTIAANFDVAPDGKSFVMVEAEEGWGQSSEVRLILDWFDEVSQLAPNRLFGFP